MNAQSALLARQPIFDRNVRVVGYEILFRATDSETNVISSPDRATAEVGVHALLDLGLDRIVGAHTGWINITRNILISGMYDFFPHERVVLELLETVEADAEVLAALERARSRGFTIALDDFELNDRTRALVPFADIVKLDVLALGEERFECATLELARPGLRLLAEKVETKAVFEHAKALHCSLFQGFFFARPEPLAGRSVKNNRMALLQLVGALVAEDASIDRIEELIRSDVGLSYRLLRYVNSVSIGMATPIQSIRHSVVTLGLDRVRACVLVLMLTAYDDKPNELVTLSLVRARYCQILCEFHGLDPQRGFLVGLMSSIDAFLDRKLESIVPEMGLSEELERALIAHEGNLGQVLDAAIACETADWERLSRSRFGPGSPCDTYMDALSWSMRMQASLAA
ncbi:MAG TPA: HDOD domain-containing protein [Planctomycetota bacterium]|nr:HDOD domain-containing protein [Planctomycetota bacterium]